MSHDLTAAQLTASAGRHRIRIWLFELYFASGTLRLALGPWDVPIGADTYIRAKVESIRQLREAANSIEGLQASMTGLDTAMMTIATQENYRGKLIRALRAYVNSDTHQVIDTPKVRFIGRMRELTPTEQNDRCSITLVAEHFDAELKRPSPTRLNDAEQQRLYPGDLGGQYVESMVERILVWPSREAFMK